MSKVKIPSGELLWRTKGLNWEYCFILIPEIDRGSWWRFYREVRAELNISSRGDQVLGSLVDRVGIEHPYIASIFLDSVLTDAAGRETEQFVVWFPENFRESALPVNLAKAAAEHFAPIINSKEMKDLSDDSDKSPDTVFHTLLPQGSEIDAEVSDTISESLRKVEIYHQLEADLATVKRPKKNPVKPLLIVAFLLITVLAVLYFTRLLPLPLH